METSDSEREILTLAGEMIRRVYENGDFSSFTPRLSNDVAVFLKDGSKICGKDNMLTTYDKSVSFPCKIEKEDKTIIKLAENIYQVVFVSTLTSREFVGGRNIRTSMILKTGKDNDFSVISLSFALLLDASAGNNIFPVEKKLPRRDRTAAREEVLINFLLEGLSNKEIAKRFSLAEITVKKALSKIYQRFGVKNRGELLVKLAKNKK